MQALILNLPKREPLEIVYKKESSPQKNLTNIDALVIETNYGFNDLGLYARHIAKAMDIDGDLFRGYADSLMDELVPTIDIVSTHNPFTPLKRVALVSSPNCASYKPFEGNGMRPNKDFFYNMVYESLAALIKMGCQRIGIAGLTGSLRFIDDPQYQNCVSQAICHVANDYPALKQILILSYGPIITHGIHYFNQHQEEAALHKHISTEQKDWYGIKRIALDIPRRF
jgi:hypothetical protein